MSCKCAKPSDEYHGWICEVSGGECVFLFPDSKQCAEDYGEGPEVNQDQCESCESFYLEEDKRCCIMCPLAFQNGEIKVSKYIEDDVISCGAFRARAIFN